MSTTTGKAAAANDNDQAEIDTANDPRNAALVADLTRYLRANNLPNNGRTRQRLGQQLGYADGTAVYRYLAAKPEGDLAKFETRLSAFLANELRIEGGGALIDDPKAFILPSMFAFLNSVRALGHIGVAHGNAGTGKTCAARLYTAAHRDTTIYTHVWSWAAGKVDVARELATAAALTMSKSETHESALRRHCRDTGTMLILDNAQRLTPKARDWLADFLDYTGTPIALIGNPEIEAQWARCDQHKRRVGLRRDVSIDYTDKAMNTAASTVRYLLQRHLPEVASDPAVQRKAMELLKGKDTGSCGAVIMHAQLVRRFLSIGQVTDPLEAWQAARTQLITDRAA